MKGLAAVRIVVEYDEPVAITHLFLCRRINLGVTEYLRIWIVCETREKLGVFYVVDRVDVSPRVC